MEFEVIVYVSTLMDCFKNIKQLNPNLKDTRGGKLALVALKDLVERGAEAGHDEEGVGVGGGTPISPERPQPHIAFFEMTKSVTFL